MGEFKTPLEIESSRMRLEVRWERARRGLPRGQTPPASWLANRRLFGDPLIVAFCLAQALDHPKGGPDRDGPPFKGPK
jgi:hypothetical protein